jgi:hypothetical protein
VPSDGQTATPAVIPIVVAHTKAKIPSDADTGNPCAITSLTE